MQNTIPPELADLETDILPSPPKTILSRRPNINGALYSLIIIFICVLLSNLYWTDLQIKTYLAATPKLVYDEQQYWRAFTTTLIHADGKHLLSNLYMLGILSYFVGGYFGFWIYPILSLIIAAIINLVSLSTYGENVILVGASGLVYFLAGFWFTSYVIIERYKTIFIRLIRVTGVALVILFPTTFEPEVSYRTHLIGFLFGILVAFFYTRLRSPDEFLLK